LRAAVVVGIIANGSVLELAGFGVAAGVVAAGGLTTAVTFFAGFNNTVAALAAAIGDDVAIVGQAVGLDTVAT
jgi:hypothetical protein